MTIHVKLFALIRDRAGTAEVSLELPEGATCADAMQRLADRWPAIADILPRAACAVNQEYVDSDTVLVDGVELALIPPVSGGSNQ